MRAVCTSSQLLLVTADGKCSAGYGRNPFLLLFLTLPLSILNKKGKKLNEKNSKPKVPTRFMSIIPYLLRTETVWDADICPSMIDLI